MKNKTVVLFRKDKTGEISAVFPQLSAGRGYFTSYAHIGQHCAACWHWARYDTKPATRAEYLPLLRELRAIGYRNLKVLNRLPPVVRCAA